MEEWKYRYWLQSIHGLQNKKRNMLVEYCGGAKELYYMKEQQLNKVCGLSKKDVEIVIKSKKTWDLEQEAERLQEVNISIATVEEENFPERLRWLEDCPYGFFYKGNYPKDTEKTVAIIGARACSSYGKAVALELGEKLASCGVSVISGMAAGIDSFGHWGAIRGGGKTYGVLGCGVDICYPKGAMELYGKIQKSGGIISEYVPGSSPAQWKFPARNRIISAFSDVLIVVEAKEKSGSLITADFALEQGKEVFAVPGRLDDVLSYGCNSLIRQGAGVVLSVEELILDLNLSLDGFLDTEEKRKKLLEKEEGLVYSCLDLHTRSLEELCHMTKMSVSGLMDVVIRLQAKGYIEESYKNHYRKK